MHEFSTSMLYFLETVIHFGDCSLLLPLSPALKLTHWLQSVSKSYGCGGCLQPECGEVLKLSGQWLRWEQEIFTSSADTRRSDLLLWWDPIIRDSTKLSLTVIKTTVEIIPSRESYASKTCSLPMDLLPAELFSTSECLFVLCDVFWLAA